MMHTLGFIHEQTRPDRDRFIELNPKNIKKGAAGDFAKRPHGDNAYFPKGTEVNAMNTPYDMGCVHGIYFGPFRKVGIVSMWSLCKVPRSSFLDVFGIELNESVSVWPCLLVDEPKGVHH